MEASAAALPFATLLGRFALLSKSTTRPAAGSAALPSIPALKNRIGARLAAVSCGSATALALFTARKDFSDEAVMARVSRMIIHVAAAAAVLALALPAGARADPDAGSAYIYVSKQFPERLYLIDGGNIIFESPANTGTRATPTPDGEFHIFASYREQTMKGTDPVTGQRYDDPDVPYVMYFDGGRAIHGFYRSSYGYPQSLGCIELPVYKARELYKLLQGGLDTEVVVAYQRPQVLYSSAAEPGPERTGFGGYFWGARS